MSALAKGDGPLVRRLERALDSAKRRPGMSSWVHYTVLEEIIAHLAASKEEPEPTHCAACTKQLPVGFVSLAVCDEDCAEAVHFAVQEAVTGGRDG